MNRSRLWTVGAVLVIVALVAGSWFLGVAPRLADARNADQTREQAIALNDAHRQALQALEEQFERRDEIIAGLDKAHRVIPELPEKSEFIAQIAELALDSGVTTTVVTFAEPTAYVPPGGAPEDYTAASNELASGGLYTIPITLNAQGSELATLGFLNGLQLGDRLVMIHTAQFSAGAEGEEPSLTLAGYIFGLSATTVAQTEPQTLATPGS